MEKLTYPLNFSCPDHPTQKLQGVDPKASADKQTYCMVCIIMSENSKSLYNSLQTFPDFLDSVTASFANVKATLKPIPNAPQEYLDVFSNKAEVLNRMTNHINEQKRKMEESIEEIKNFFLEILDQKKTEFCKILDEQVSKFSAEYDFFETELRMSYPRQEDLDKFFPTKEELESRFRRVENAAECDSFIKKVKKELEENTDKISRSLLQDQVKRPYLDLLKKELISIENAKPVFEVNIQLVKDEFKKILDQNKTFHTLKNPIPQQSLGMITAEELLVVKAWLPEQFKVNFTPKLIYKGTRDGMSPQVFHSQCDGKGPTITFIKCKFQGSSEMTVIGGFLDTHWQSIVSYLASDNSFLFSLDSRIKCPISHKQYGAYQNANYGPTFGGHDLHINQNLEQSYVTPHSYTNTAAIVKSPIYVGFGKINFMPYDIEVYTINP